MALILLSLLGSFKPVAGHQKEVKAKFAVCMKGSLAFYLLFYKEALLPSKTRLEGKVPVDSLVSQQQYLEGGERVA
eukprot:497216-Pelagomonas_calceolata.AAC.3